MRATRGAHKPGPGGGRVARTTGSPRTAVSTTHLAPRPQRGPGYLPSTRCGATEDPQLCKLTGILSINDEFYLGIVVYFNQLQYAEDGVPFATQAGLDEHGFLQVNLLKDLEFSMLWGVRNGLETARGEPVVRFLPQTVHH